MSKCVPGMPCYNEDVIVYTTYPPGCRTTVPSPFTLPLSSTDVYYSGADLPNSSITTNELLTTALQKIDTAFENYVEKTYYTYTVLLSQTSTSNPVATILDNSLGAVVWTRSFAGEYHGTLTGAFPILKTVIPNFFSLYGLGTTMIPISNGNQILGYYQIFQISNDQICINTYNNLFVLTEWSSVIGASTLSLDIRVYI